MRWNEFKFFKSVVDRPKPEVRNYMRTVEKGLNITWKCSEWHQIGNLSAK